MATTATRQQSHRKYCSEVLVGLMTHSESTSAIGHLMASRERAAALELMCSEAQCTALVVSAEVLGLTSVVRVMMPPAERAEYDALYEAIPHAPVSDLALRVIYGTHLAAVEAAYDDKGSAFWADYQQHNGASGATLALFPTAHAAAAAAAAAPPGVPVLCLTSYTDKDNKEVENLAKLVALHQSSTVKDSTVTESMNQFIRERGGPGGMVIVADKVSTDFAREAVKCCPVNRLWLELLPRSAEQLKTDVLGTWPVQPHAAVVARCRAGTLDALFLAACTGKPLSSATEEIPSIEVLGEAREVAAA